MLRIEFRARARLTLVASVTACLANCGPETSGYRLVPVTVGDSAGIAVHSVADLPAWDVPEYQWRLDLDRTIPTEGPNPGDPPVLYGPQGYARLPDGTLVVLDSGDPRIAVIPPSNPGVRTRFGATGQGPGEIWSQNTVIWPAGEGIWVLDPGNQRLSRFDLDGTLEEEEPIEIGGMGGFATQNPRTGEPYMMKIFFEDFDARTLVDSVGHLETTEGRVRFIAAMPPRVEARRTSTSPVALFSPKGWYAPIGAGGVVTGRSDGARFHYYADDGTLVRIIAAPMEQTPIQKSEEPAILQEFYGELRPSPTLGRAQIADAYPVWDILWPFNDSIFAVQQSYGSTPAGEPRIPRGQIVWRLFTVTGHYAGAVVFPPAFANPFWIEDGRVVGTRRDSLGVATVESYRLSAPAGAGAG